MHASGLVTDTVLSAMFLAETNKEAQTHDTPTGKEGVNALSLKKKQFSL